MLRDVIRRLIRAPGYAAATIAVFAVGLAAAGASFAVVDGVLLKPLPVRAADELFLARRVAPSTTQPGSFSEREISALADRLGHANVAAYGFGLFDPRRARADGLAGATVTPNFFDVLGAPVRFGPGLTSDPVADGSPRPVVIADHLFRSRFGADRSAIGRVVDMAGERIVIVGVAPPGLDVPDHTNVWAALAVQQRRYVFRNLTGVLRLDDGPASARTTVLDGATLELRPLAEQMRPTNAGAMRIILVTTLALVVIACLHLASLQLSRMAARAHEVRVKLALGASRRRIASEWTIEAALLYAAGVLAAFALGRPALSVLLGVLPPDVAASARIDIDWRTMAFLALAGGMALAASGLFLWNASAGRVAFVAQTALVGALLYVALVGVSSYRAAGLMPLGVTVERLHAAWVPVPHEQDAVLLELRRQLEASPEIASVAWGGSPLEPNRLAVSVSAVSASTAHELAGLERNADERRVGADYLQTAGIGIVSGRTFDPQRDHEDAVVLSRTLSRIVGAAAGDTVYVNGRPALVVGVAADVYVDGPENVPRPLLYRLSDDPRREFLLRMRSGDPSALVNETAARVAGADTHGYISSVSTRARELTADQRSRAAVLGFCASSALLLVLASAIQFARDAASRRLREAAIKLALGAKPHRVSMGLVARTCLLSATGLGAGLLVGTWGAWLMRTRLFGVEPFDVSALVATAAVTLGAAVAGSLPAAARLAALDTADVLRQP